MNKPHITFMGTIFKTIATHCATYLIAGWLAITFFSHVSLPDGGGAYPVIRPLNDPLVIAGTALQVFRGALFGITFYLLREPLFGKKNAGFMIWFTLIAFGILGTFAPASGSLEGMIFTYQPLLGHLYSLPELLLQSLLLSLLLHYWVIHPEKKWLNWLLGSAFFIAVGLSLLGLIMSR